MVPINIPTYLHFSMWKIINLIKFNFLVLIAFVRFYCQSKIPRKSTQPKLEYIERIGVETYTYALCN